MERFYNVNVYQNKYRNKIKFDYRGLIEKSLAIKALESMYNIK